MTTNRESYFPRGADYPNEGFVQAAVQSHFLRLGFHLNSGNSADVDCVHPESNERWIVEAKGYTSDCGLDFRTALGQILQQMNEQHVRYAIAIPDIPQFTRQCNKVPRHVCNKLRLNWLVVSSNSSVRIVEPNPDHYEINSNV